MSTVGPPTQALRWSDVDLEAVTLRVRGGAARVAGNLEVTEPKQRVLSARATVGGRLCVSRAGGRLRSELQVPHHRLRRPSRSSDLEPGKEIAVVLSLEPDATSVPNPTSAKPAAREGPLD